jgi:hypothetical protein
MANTNAPFGFQQYSGLGSAPTYEMATKLIAYDNATKIFQGDPVVDLNTGYIAQASSNTAANGVAGIFVGCTYLSVSQKRVVWSNYWPGADANSSAPVTAYVVNDPNAQFLVQAGGSTTPIGQADVGSNIGFGVGSGNTANGISTAYADQGSLNTANTYPFRIVGLLTFPPGAPGTDVTTGYNRIIVAFNNVATKQLTGI